VGVTVVFYALPAIEEEFIETVLAVFFGIWLGILQQEAQFFLCNSALN
jgi:hypothetical protein